MITGLLKKWLLSVKTLSEVSNDSLTQQVNNISHTGKRIILHNWVFIFSSSKETSTVLKKKMLLPVSQSRLSRLIHFHNGNMENSKMIPKIITLAGRLWYRPSTLQYCWKVWDLISVNLIFYIYTKEDCNMWVNPILHFFQILIIFQIHSMD